MKFVRATEVVKEQALSTWPALGHR